MSLEKDQLQQMLIDHYQDRDNCLQSRQEYLVGLTSLTYLSDRAKGLFKSLARCGCVNTLWLDDRRLMSQSNLVEFSASQELAKLKPKIQTDLDREFPWPVPSQALIDGLNALDR